MGRTRSRCCSPTSSGSRRWSWGSVSGTPTGPRRLLLVLDNFEHLTPAAPVVGQLLAACPDLVILVTSRDVLRLPGERDYALPPLALPPAGRENTVDDLLAAPAVRLFVERVQEVRPGFVAGVREAPVIAEICRRLDGLPLAIELAAVRVRMLPPAARAATAGASHSRSQPWPV